MEKRKIIIYSKCWPISNVIRFTLEKINEEFSFCMCNDELDLLNFAINFPKSTVIADISASRSLFLLLLLKLTNSQRKLIIYSKNNSFADDVITSYINGCKPENWFTLQSGLVNRLFLGEEGAKTVRFSTNLFSNFFFRTELESYSEIYKIFQNKIYKELKLLGANQQDLMVSEYFRKGCCAFSIAKIMNISVKTVYRRRSRLVSIIEQCNYTRDLYQQIIINEHVDDSKLFHFVKSQMLTNSIVDSIN